MMLNAANSAQKALDQLRAMFSDEEDAVAKVQYQHYLQDHCFEFGLYETLSFLPWARRRLRYWKAMAEAEYIHWTAIKENDAHNV